jgi:hypothetical protein
MYYAKMSKAVSSLHSNTNVWLDAADKSKANSNVTTSIGTSENVLYSETRHDVSTHNESPVPAPVATNSIWDTFDFDQIIEQQFLDPSWLDEPRG